MEDEELGTAPTVVSTDGDTDGAPSSRLTGDKYRIVRAIGVSSIGTIYLARDLRLDRDVALEVGAESSAEARERLDREVQALARLSHPNVVAVYEIGELEGKSYIAREHVPGTDARAWVAVDGRTAAEIIALYAGAGDGLAAAHGAGVVHGDVRADSILVGEDGRPRLAHFGRESSSDARADQRAFCMALGDALKSARDVPRHVTSALRRGSDADPSRRWASVSALVAELRRDPSRQRRRVALGVGTIATIGGAAVLALALRAGNPAPCTDDGTALAPVWSAERAAVIARAFEGAGGATAWGTLRARFDAYANQWIVARQEACRATRIDKTQPEGIMDRRMLCLEKGRAQLDSLLAALAAGGRAVVEGAPLAASVLPDLSRCADVSTLARVAAVPADPEVRTKIERATREVADARTSLVWGAKGGVVTGEQILATATATGWPPLIADAQLVRAALLMDAQEVERGRIALEQAAKYAIENELDETAGYATAWLGKSFAEAGRRKDAEHWIGLAHGLWTKAGEPPGLGDVLARAESSLANDHGDFDASLAATRRGIEMARRVNGATPSDNYNLANALEQAGKLDEGAKEIAVGLAAAETQLGHDHPSVARFAYKAAELEMYMTRYPAALALARRSVAITEKWYGRDDVHLVDALEILGTTLARAGQPEDARATLDRAIAILEAHSPDSAELNIIENIIADMEGRLGHWDAAAEHGARALASDEARFGKDSPYVMTGLVMLATANRHRHEVDASAHLLERAAAIGTKTLGAAAPETINAETELSYTRIAQGRIKDAAALLESALGLVEKATGMPEAIAAEAHQAYADALWRAGGDHARARAAAVVARDGYAKLGAEFTQQTKDSEAWLAAHR